MTATSDGFEDEHLDQARSGPQTGSLNQDPHNMQAEALAMETCMRGAGSCRTWSEQEMVFSFGGGEIPGTPDFMYENPNGVLTCGQVVRVPIVRGMSRTMVSETIYCTVLTKLVKSQVWMKSCCIVPQEFIIFLWLPFFIHRRRKRLAEALAMQVQRDGWPFLLRFEVPDSPEILFPPMFAASLNPRVKKVSESDLSNFDPRHFEEEEDAMEWDVFGFDDTEDNEQVEDTEDSMMNDYETDSESDEGGLEGARDFGQEQQIVVWEDLAGHVNVEIVFLGSSASSNRGRDPSSPRLLHPSDLDNKWDLKSPCLATPKRWHCSPGLPFLVHRLQTWETKPPTLVGAC